MKGHLVVVQENNLWTFMRHRSADSVREGLLLYRREGGDVVGGGSPHPLSQAENPPYRWLIGSPTPSRANVYTSQQSQLQAGCCTASIGGFFPALTGRCAPVPASLEMII